MPNGLNRTGTNRRWLERWPPEFALCATFADGFIKPVSDAGEELVALMKNRIVSERGAGAAAEFRAFRDPILQFATWAQSCIPQVTTRATSVCSNFSWFPTDVFRRGTRFHFVRARFLWAIGESGAQGRRRGRRNRR